MEITNIFKSEWKLLSDIPNGTILRCHPLHQVNQNSDEPEYYACGESQKPCPDCGKQMLFRPYFLTIKDDKERPINTGIFTSFCNCYENRRTLHKNNSIVRIELTPEQKFQQDVERKRQELEIKKQQQEYERKVLRAAKGNLEDKKDDDLPY